VADGAKAKGAKGDRNDWVLVVRIKFASQENSFFYRFDFLLAIRRSSYNGGAWVSPMFGFRRIKKTLHPLASDSIVGQLFAFRGVCIGVCRSMAGDKTAR
jgi:hypothetical protein